MIRVLGIGLVLIIATGCFKTLPEQSYANTLSEAFEVLQSSEFPELQRLAPQDLVEYKQEQARSLQDSLSTQGEHFCISVKGAQSNPTYYIENTLLMLNFLSVYGSIGPNYWDTNNDQLVNTSDLINLLTGYDTQAPGQPDFSCYDIFDSFGEGNTWLTYTCEDAIEFGWLHRTPYDEINTPTYLGYNLYTFTLDEVRQDTTIFYEYLRP